MQSHDATVHSSDTTSHIRELTRRRRHADALAAARDLAFLQPHNRDALYLLAANQRCLRLIPDALDTLSRLEQEHAAFGRLHQERGFCFLTMRDPARAIAALQRAVILNPALMTSWDALESLYRAIGDNESAAAAGKQAAQLRSLPAEIVQAGSLFSEGDLGAAETQIRAYLKSATHVEALRLLARIEQQRDALHQAECLLQSVLAQAPGYRAARADYARVLIGRQKYLEAGAEIDSLLQLEPDNVDYRSLQASARAGSGDHETAIAAYRELTAAHQDRPYLYLLLGHSLKAMGQQREAVESYRAARNARPDFGDAYWSLANLKAYRFSDADIGQMQTALAASATQAVDRLHLHFALGWALETRERYAESWEHYAQGNALKRSTSGHEPQAPEIDTRRQIDVCTAQLFAERAGVGAPDAGPIFIVGLPRSGSTLIEQILGSHPLIEATQELNIIPRIVQELQGRYDSDDPQYPRVLRELTAEDFRALGGRYLAEARGLCRAGSTRPFFVDKMPDNFRHLGLIHLMLPNARIIDARREPMACCFSNFKQLFAGGQDFSYSLESIARSYRAYLELMRHWDAVLPGRVHRVLHDLVEDLSTNVHRLLDFCGLEFEPACVDFHNTRRAIGTPSSEQVRQPINRDGLHQWRHYRRWLGKLEDMLGDARDRYRT